MRMAMPLQSLEKRAPEERARDERVFDWVRETLAQGGVLTPEGTPE